MSQLSLKMNFETTSAVVDEVMRSEVTRGEIEPQANVGPSGEILVKNQSTNPENPAQDHVLEANSKSIKDGGCLKSKAYEDQVADYRNSQRRRFNTSKKTLLVGDSMTKQANVGPSGEILVKNHSTNPEKPAQDHFLQANSKSIKDGGCLKSKAYEDQVADYRSSQGRMFNTSKKTLLVEDSMTKHICNQKVGRACRGLSKCYTYSGATVHHG